MIETRKVGPGFDRVARFTSSCSSVSPPLSHLFIELAVMWVLVAAGAGAVVETIRRGRCRGTFATCRVALGTGYGEMSASQGKAALLVLRDRVCRRAKAFDRVAQFAPVLVRSCCKLTRVCVAMAIETFREGYLVLRRGPRGHMALIATDALMFAFERVGGQSMLLDSKQRGLPTIHGVTPRTFALVLSLCELASMWIGCVAIGTLCECDWFLEISTGMALDAADGNVFAEERELRLRVVELLVRGNLLPARGRVAGFA